MNITKKYKKYKIKLTDETIEDYCYFKIIRIISHFKLLSKVNFIKKRSEF